MHNRNSLIATTEACGAILELTGDIKLFTEVEQAIIHHPEQASNDILLGTLRTIGKRTSATKQLVELLNTKSDYELSMAIVRLS